MTAICSPAIIIPTDNRADWLRARKQGIGGSEIAAVMGLSSYATAFDVYADKLDLVQRIDNPDPRMAWGKKLERFIAEQYAAETGNAIVWLDQLHQHAERSWQIGTPDFICISGERGGDSKNVAADQAYKWGEPGTQDVPDDYAIQAHWLMSIFDVGHWDIAAFFGGNDLCIYPIKRDLEIEAELLEAGERFWHDHVLANVPPPMGNSPRTSEYLKAKYPSSSGQLRKPSPDELNLIERYRGVRANFDAAKDEKESLENQIKNSIGSDDGLSTARGNVTWRQCKDTTGTDWKGIAITYVPNVAEVEKQFQIVTRKGSRKFDWRVK